MKLHPLCFVLAAMIFLAEINLQAATLSPTFSGNNLDSVTVDRDGTTKSFSSGELISGNLTSFDGASAAVGLVPDGTGFPAPGGRAALLSDNNVATGVINPEVGSSAARFDFAAPVKNGPGADIIAFEIDPATEGNDLLAVLINGISQSIAPEAGALKAASNHDVYSGQGGGDVDSLAELENDAFSLTSNNTPQALFGFLIELDDFGVPLGGSINFLQFGSDETGDSTTVDPTFFAGLPTTIPEPASVVIWILLGSICGVLGAWRVRAIGKTTC